MCPHIASGTQFSLRSGHPVPDVKPERGHDAEADRLAGSDLRHRERSELAHATQELLERARTVSEPESIRLRDEAVTNYLWLADSIARRYKGRGEDNDDLVQIARTGLVEAALRYNAACGSFPAFAAPTISGVLKRHFRDRGWLVRPPRPVQETVSEVSRAWSQLAQRLGAEPDDRAVAAQIGQPLDAVRRARFARGGYVACSLDAAVNVGSVVDDSSADQDLVEDRLMVARAWRRISRSERQLLIMRFFEDRSQSDIAAELGISQMQVSRILTRTFKKMRSLIAGSHEGRSIPADIRPFQLAAGSRCAPVVHG